MKLRYIIVAAGLSFVIGLIAHAPAASIYAWIVDGRSDPPVQLHGVSGSLLAGSAMQLGRDFQWRLVPAALLLGRAEYRLKTDAPPLLLDGGASVNLLGTVRVGQTRASGELRALAAIIGQPFIPVNGQLGLDLQSLTLADQWPREAQGRIQVLGLSWALGREPVPLGDFEAVVETDELNIVATVSTLKGVIDAGGTATLSAEGAYALDLQLRATSDAPPMVANLLRSLGQADARGYHRLRRQGQIREPADKAQPAQVPDAQRPSYLLPG